MGENIVDYNVMHIMTHTIMYSLILFLININFYLFSKFFIIFHVFHKFSVP